METNDTTDNQETEIRPEDLEKYKKQILEALHKEVDTSNPQSVLEYLHNHHIKDVPHLERPSKLLICPHEIIFNIIAYVLEENEKGETIGTKEVCQKDFHIPVPPEHDYNVYMDVFFKHLEEAIKSSAKQATKESEPKTNE